VLFTVGWLWAERVRSMRQKPLLKQGWDLTPNDFLMYPVWIQCHCVDYDEPWYEETDETTFRPWTGPLPVGPEEGMLLVHASLTLADGTKMSGFLTPQFEGEPLHLGAVQPSLFGPSGELLHFWDGMFKRPSQKRDWCYDVLGKTAKQVFPLTFAAESGLARGQTEGMIAGFCWLGQDGAVHFYT